VLLVRSVETFRVLERKTCSSGIRDADMSPHFLIGHCEDIFSTRVGRGEKRDVRLEDKAKKMYDSRSPGIG